MERINPTQEITKDKRAKQAFVNKSTTIIAINEKGY